MESVINKAIGWFKNISEAATELTSGNVSHKSCTIRGMANRSSEYLEKHKRNLSVIKWQIGEPKEEGYYLVTLRTGEVRAVQFYQYEVAGNTYWNNSPYGMCMIKAWCKLTDIEPYNEKDL